MSADKILIIKVMQPVADGWTTKWLKSPRDEQTFDQQPELQFKHYEVAFLKDGRYTRAKIADTVLIDNMEKNGMGQIADPQYQQAINHFVSTLGGVAILKGRYLEIESLTMHLGYYLQVLREHQGQAKSKYRTDEEKSIFRQNLSQKLCQVCPLFGRADLDSKQDAFELKEDKLIQLMITSLDLYINDTVVRENWLPDIGGLSHASAGQWSAVSRLRVMEHFVRRVYTPEVGKSPALLFRQFFKVLRDEKIVDIRLNQQYSFDSELNTLGSLFTKGKSAKKALLEDAGYQTLLRIFACGFSTILRDIQQTLYRGITTMIPGEVGVFSQLLQQQYPEASVKFKQEGVQLEGLSLQKVCDYFIKAANFDERVSRVARALDVLSHCLDTFKPPHKDVALEAVGSESADKLSLFMKHFKGLPLRHRGSRSVSSNGVPSASQRSDQSVWHEVSADEEESEEEGSRVESSSTPPSTVQGFQQMLLADVNTNEESDEEESDEEYDTDSAGPGF